jgi:hypothetical protein
LARPSSGGPKVSNADSWHGFVAGASAQLPDSGALVGDDWVGEGVQVAGSRDRVMVQSLDARQPVGVLSSACVTGLGMIAGFGPRHRPEVAAKGARRFPTVIAAHGIIGGRVPRQ